MATAKQEPNLSRNIQVNHVQASGNRAGGSGPTPSSGVKGKLMSRKGLPIVAAAALAFVFGIAGLAALGVVLAVVLGLFLLRRSANFNLQLKPWPALVSKLMPIAGRILFLMVFFLPIADYLYLPSGHTPDTLVKYISIMFVKPENLAGSVRSDYFPGLPLIVLLSAIIMAIGIIRIQKTKYLLLSVVGIVLYTLSPTLSYLIMNGTFRFMFIWEFLNIGYYCAWAGIALIILAKFTPRLLGRFTSQNRAVGFLVLLPLAAVPSIVASLILPSLHISAVTLQAGLDFETAHHSLAVFISAILAALGVGAIIGNEQDNSFVHHINLELTYPAGKSPLVFTRGWLFGAKATLVKGEEEIDVTENVEWSGTGAFEPNYGSRSRPAFFSDGPNTIKLKCEADGLIKIQKYKVNAKDPGLYAHVGSMAQVPADSHGCPACPHTCTGPITSGSPTVLVNGLPAARVGDVGTHAACCGPNTFEIANGDNRVLIDGKPAAWIGSQTNHCGGTGKVVSGGSS
jgi:uncharacterized Zn-binding protein involved in type VI secretion